jgi:hypothetical protein
LRRGSASGSLSDKFVSTPPLTVALLRARRERPCCRAAEQRDELAALHIAERNNGQRRPFCNERRLPKSLDQSAYNPEQGA